MIRALLPDHLLTLARMHSEVLLEVESPPTLSGVLDVLEPCYPVLRGTIRDQITGPLRPFVRFFACKEDLSHYPPEQRLTRSYRLWWGAVPGHRRHCRRLEEEALTRAVCAGLSARANVPSKKWFCESLFGAGPPSRSDSHAL
jgi:sulfur-carrier protein